MRIHRRSANYREIDPRVWTRGSLVLGNGGLLGGHVTSTADSGKTAKDILSAIEGDHMDASTFYGEDSFTKNTEKLYGIEADKLSDGGILYSSDGNYADEISMLKMADGSSAKSQLADRLSYRLNQYENYKPEETKKIQAAKIFQAGDYWVLVISDNADEISDEITDMIN